MTIRSGDTFEKIFSTAHIKKFQYQSVLKNTPIAANQLKPGQIVTVYFNQNNTLRFISVTQPKTTRLVPQALFQSPRRVSHEALKPGSIKQKKIQHPEPHHTQLKIKKQNKLSNHFVSSVHTAQALQSSSIDPALHYVSGTIQSSVLETIHNINGPKDLKRSIHHILQKNMQLKRIHIGDQFAFLYHACRTHSNGGCHEILAMEWNINGKKHYAIKFQYPQHTGNYYTPTGNNLSERFLKYPTQFKSISSHFNYTRFDPVTHRVHAHLAVDFSAPQGTPIYSIGDGRITSFGFNKGYGNCIRIDYGSGYAGLYAHLHHFAAHLKPNQYVRKGQLLGHVGSTGYSTGPHLHFAFYDHGKPMDWLRVKHSINGSIPSNYLQKFYRTSRILLAQLDTHRNIQLASNERRME